MVGMEATGTPDSARPSSAAAWSHVIGVFDLETTGIDVETDRIVTAHVGLLDASGTVIRARDWIADPGIEIPAGATAVHGITTARARAEGRPAAEVIERDQWPRCAHCSPPASPSWRTTRRTTSRCSSYEAVRHGIEPIASPSPVIDPLVWTRRSTGTARASAPSTSSRRTTPCCSTVRTRHPPTRSPPAGWPRPSPQRFADVLPPHGRRAAHAPDRVGPGAGDEPHRVLHQHRPPRPR